MKITKATLHKYKCINTDQEFDVNEDITILVGMNESGKTSILECLAKTNYFEDDDTFKFNDSHDYPRRERKNFSKNGTNPEAISVEFQVGEALLKEIADDIGEGVFTESTVTHTCNYGQKNSWSGVSVNKERFWRAKLIEESLVTKYMSISSKEELTDAISELESEDGLKETLSSLMPYFKNTWDWGSSALAEYVARNHLQPNRPKFLYYDEYYSLPSRISIEKLQNNDSKNEESKTAKAFFDLADIDIDELINSDDFEDFKSELEATQAIISDELFKYWSSNTHLDIEFAIDKQIVEDRSGYPRVVEHILDIRVKNQRTKVSLPLKNRSKGFNWFFSFLVWFKKIQEDQTSNYVLLLDEPGLNLHASAQADLLNFIDDLSKDYQIIYTTHSPFMVPSDALNRVRTVVDTDSGSQISDSIQEKDPNTLFPLQAALGYDIAQNLYISKKNLLVEGVSDLIYLQVMSGFLESSGRTGLTDDITIVPVGGLEKVSTFVSLLRGNNLNITCLLDSTIDPSSKSKLDKLVKEKIVKEKKIIFYDQFLPEHKEADIEDIFEKEDYLKLYNGAFDKDDDIEVGDLNEKVKRIILQINKHLNVKRFNHYAPANYLTKVSLDESYFQSVTLNRFEEMFKALNETF